MERSASICLIFKTVADPEAWSNKEINLAADHLELLHATIEAMYGRYGKFTPELGFKTTPFLAALQHLNELREPRSEAQNLISDAARGRQRAIPLGSVVNQLVRE